MLPSFPRRLLAGATLFAAAAALAAGSAHAAPPLSRNVTLLAHVNDYAAQGLYSACWSYVHSDGREYAVIGHQTGTAIYNIVNPQSPALVGFIPGANSIWREMKQYRDWIYVSTEGVSGVQIIRMTNPESPVLAATWNATINQAHTLTMDTTRALLYVNGSRQSGFTPNDRGMRVVSLQPNPESPVELTFYNPNLADFADDWYVHDSHVAGNRLFLSCIYGGFVRVLDTTNPSAPAEIAAWTYPGAFTHNSWSNAAGTHLFVTDEITGEPLKVFDITNLAAPVLVGEWTSNPAAIVHNTHVLADTAFCSNYTEGVRLLDISDPATPAEFGYYDTFVGTPSSVFDGCWEVAPYFPSGVFIASDRQSGLYVFRSNPVYGRLKVHVREAGTMQPVPGAMVRLEGGGDSLSTPFHGDVRFAPSPGLDEVQVRKFGWSREDVPFSIAQGQDKEITITISQLPTSDLGGTVRAEADGQALDGADVSLAYTSLAQASDPSGFYYFPAVPADIYQLDVARPGYAFARRWVELPGNSVEYLDVDLLKAAFYDSCDTDQGWILGGLGDDATSGVWLRADPVGTTAGPDLPARVAARLAAQCAGDPLLGEDPPLGPSLPRGLEPLHDRCEEPVLGTPQPEDDHTSGASVMCFVTGNGPPGGGFDIADVDGGKTTLISPLLDLSGMSDARIGFWRWFYTGQGPPDYFAVDLSANGGANWVNAETLHVNHDHWHADEIKVSDYVTPTSTVRVRFVVADVGAASIVEGLVDDFAAYDALTPVGVLPAPPARMAFAPPAPNPGGALQRLSLGLPRAGRVEVQVVDLAGRAVRTLYRGEAPAGTLPLTWDGSDDRGRRVVAGLYWAKAVGVAGEATAKLVRVGGIR